MKRREDHALIAAAPDFAAEVVRLHDEFAALADGLEAEAENLCEWGSVQEGAKGSGLAEAAARIREVIEWGKA